LLLNFAGDPSPGTFAKASVSKALGMTLFGLVRFWGGKQGVSKKTDSFYKISIETPLLPSPPEKRTCHPEFRQIGASGDLEE